ncbi:hypothetical protein HDU96_000199 [Phlyctochytrium bullatum]|nr:hypothetical protein HDU96_000199 [Phlyctochytrium bullatum]
MAMVLSPPAELPERISIESLPRELCRQILLLIPPSDVPDLLQASRNVRRLFRPTNAEVQFAHTHIRHHAPSPQDAFGAAYNAFIKKKVSFWRLPYAYALAVLMQADGGGLTDELGGVATSILYEELLYKADQPSWIMTKELWAERVCAAALNLDWSVEGATVTLGGLTADKNKFLEVLARLAVTFGSTKAAHLLVDLQRTRIPYNFVRKTDPAADTNTSTTAGTNIGFALPNLLHFMLRVACERRAERFVCFLLEEFPINFTPLMDRMRALDDPKPLFYLATLSTDQAILEALLKCHEHDKLAAARSKPSTLGYDPDLSRPDREFGRSPLHVAETAAIAALLLRHGADPNARDFRNRAPLHAACDRVSCADDVALVRVLVEHGADVTAVADVGTTPLHHAAMSVAGGTHVRVLVARVLLDAGADPNVIDRRGRTPMHYACLEDDEVLGRLLVERGAVATVADNGGNTPLMFLRNHSQRKRFFGFA